VLLAYLLQSSGRIHRDFDRMINGITLEAVNGAVRKCFDPAGLIIVAVGKSRKS
jgi:predicted Zn-dependent peptidase